MATLGVVHFGLDHFISAPAECPNPKLRKVFTEQSTAWLLTLQNIVDDEVATQQAIFESKVEDALRQVEKERYALRTLERQLEERERDLARREKQLQMEKADMQGNRGSRDVINLNVGGQERCSVFRSTLTLAEESMLAVRFSGRWDDGAEKDSNGSFFINFPPDIFIPLLDYLRQKEIEPMTPDDPVSAPDIPPGKRPDFLRMVKYYGLGSLFSTVRLRLDRGDAKQVVVDQEALHVSSEGWSTVSLDAAVTWTSILCYEVVVTDVREPQVGWVTDSFKSRPHETAEGVGDCQDSWGIDGHYLWHNGKGVDINFSWQVGDIVRCSIDRVAKRMRWHINDCEVVDVQLPHERLIPAVSGMGTWTFRVIEDDLQMLSSGD